MQKRLSKKVMETFKQMQLSNVKLNFVTFTSILLACATMGVLEEGMHIHQIIIENGFSSNIIIVNANII